MSIDSDIDFNSMHVKSEEEVFEITDFTNASDWEKFITQIEEKISDWHLNGCVKLRTLEENELISSDWETLTANLSFTGVPFTMTLHRIKEKEDIEQITEVTDEDDDRIQLPDYVQDMMNFNNDFPARTHCLARWYGLRCFLVLSIASSSGVASRSKCNLLSSSIAIALSNTSCDVPFFVQVHESWRRMFEGHAMSSGISTAFEMIHLKKCPAQYNDLSGLLHVFKTKIGLTSLLAGSSRISARFTYVLNDWGHDGKWPSKPTDPDALGKNFGALVSGSLDDPISELQLAAIWPSLVGDMVIDNNVHSDFKPLTAPLWAIRLCYADDVSFLLSSYLYELMKAADRSETMADLLNVLHDEPEKDISNALSRITDQSKTVLPIVPGKLASGLSKVVTDSQSILRKSAYSLGRIAAVRERMSRDTLNDLKQFLFSQSHTDNSYSTQERTIPSVMYSLCHKLKAAPIDSLTYRLATCAVVINICHGGLSALAQMWHLFVSELRSFLDSATPLPDMEKVNPDLSTCLLHQKFQMLNCCINRKKQREARHSSFVSSSDENKELTQEISTENMCDNTDDSTGKAVVSSSSSGEYMETTSDMQWSPDLRKGNIDDSTTEESENLAFSTKQSPVKSNSDDSKGIFSVNSDDSDEEFFECESDVEIDDNEISEKNDDAEVFAAKPQVPDQSLTEKDSSNTNDNSDIDAVEKAVIEDEENIDTSYSAEGQLHPCGSLYLLKHNKPLFVPVTQDHAPVTEDLLEEQADVFSKLGDTKEGSKVRAKMQSASLISDMQAFKAANPGCVLGDFVRWYSPRDFEDGKLSLRMKLPGNLWVSSWIIAKPVPVSRQKRIFDDTKEAEKVLHFLTNLKPGEVVQLLLPVCTYEALLVLRLSLDELSECLPSLPLLCNQIEYRATQLFRSWRMHGCVANHFTPWTNEVRAKVEDLYRQIAFAENLIERARSLQHKFANIGSKSEVNLFVRQLLEHPEVLLEEAAEGKVGCAVRYFFQNQQNRARAAQDSAESETESTPPKPVPPLPLPAGREFIIRATHAYPTAGSRELPHRLYAVIMQNEFRIATAVSSDTTFF